MYNSIARSLTGGLKMHQTKLPLSLIRIALEYPPSPSDPSRHCRWCMDALSNGHATCCDECNANWYQIVPRIDDDRDIVTERMLYARLVQRWRRMNGRSASA
jgi:hypothetical protein